MSMTPEELARLRAEAKTQVNAMMGLVLPHVGPIVVDMMAVPIRAYISALEARAAEVERLEAELAQLEANALEAIRRLTLQRDELRAG